MDQHFDAEELRTLCADLCVDYDNLQGEGKAAKARELVQPSSNSNRFGFRCAADTTP